MAPSNFVLPTGTRRVAVSLTHGRGEIATVDQPVFGPGRFRRFLAIRRAGAPWCVPAWGDAVEAVPPATVCLLLERPRGYAVVLPLVTNATQPELSGHREGLSLAGGRRDDANAPLSVLLAEGSDATSLLAAAVAAAADFLGGFKPRSAKPAPAWIDRFGWCTWDSFRPYRNVTAKGLLAGLEAFADAGLVPPLVILDDGWQDSDPELPTWGGLLAGLGTQATRFPDGLAPVVAAARAHGVQTFGVWHTLEGYWEGVRPDSAAGRTYGVTATANGTPWPDRPGMTPTGLIPSTQVARFYHDYHRRLADAGVDLVKVDNQGGLPRHLDGVEPAVATTRVWQEALQASVAVHLDGNLLTCMGMDPLVWFRMRLANVARNSGDYAPHDGFDHAGHVLTNAYNALLSSQFAIPDWDCFWSGHQHGAYHAAARALSGGPVYISDLPGGFDRALLRRLVVSGGQVLRPARPALPCADLLFADPRSSGNALAIHTVCGGNGSLGLFHPGGEAPVTASIAAERIPELAGLEVAVYRASDEAVQRLKPDEKIESILSPHGWDIATLAPLRNGVAVFGSLDHLHSAGHLLSHEALGRGHHRILLRHGCRRLGLYCTRVPRRILVDDKPLPSTKIRWDATRKLLTLNIRGDRTVEVTLG